MGKKVYLKGKAHYMRPYFLDTGENLDEDSDLKKKIMSTEGVYTTRFKLVDPETDEVFTSRDDAIDYLKNKGVPTEGLFGNLVTRDPETKEVLYKVTRPHAIPSFKDPIMGPPEVKGNEYAYDEGGNPVLNDWGKPVFADWDKEVLIGNDSMCTFKLDVWRGNKKTSIRWEGVRVEDLVEFEHEEQDDVVGF